MLTVLGGLAEFERELIRARTDDGRTRAKARGVKFGRPVKLTAHQRKEAIQRLAEGAVQADLARSYGVSQATISRLAAPSPFEASPVVGWEERSRGLGLLPATGNAAGERA
jgi:DNA invertase Pin-like site-specific DNA recombinase